MKKALITGITGQDGSYLAEFLLAKGYEVHGIKRRSSSFNTQRIDHIFQEAQDEDKRFFLHHGDMTDSACLLRLLEVIRPDEIYNLAAQSHVAVSFEEPLYTADSDALGALRILEGIRILGLERSVKYYQAGTSELYGKVQAVPQNELTTFYPRSPYAIAKLYAHWITINYREAFGLFACNGILFNHESPRRGETFVTRKISRGVARIYAGLQDKLYLGNLNARRDWGHASDFVKAQWLLLQQEEPLDLCIATGEQRSVRDFVTVAAAHLGIEVRWEGSGLSEKGFFRFGGREKLAVEVDSRYFRPAEVDELVGDASRARDILGWKPEVCFEQLVHEMVTHDLKVAQLESQLHIAKKLDA